MIIGQKIEFTLKSQKEVGVIEHVGFVPAQYGPDSSGYRIEPKGPWGFRLLIWHKHDYYEVWATEIKLIL